MKCASSVGVAALLLIVALILKPAQAATFKVAAMQIQPATSSDPRQTIAAAAGQVSSTLLGLTKEQSNIEKRPSRAAAQDPSPVDLVVFPEYGMLGSFAPSTDLCTPSNFTFADVCVPVPAVGSSVTCHGPLHIDNPFQLIACASGASAYENVSVSINLCERCDAANGNCNTTVRRTGGGSEAARYFNTQVVMRGTRIVARYRKFHPWATACYDTPELGLETFTLAPGTDRLGLFTCFDIVFPQPSGGLLDEGVRTFSYSSAIPLVGRLAVSAFSLIHNATMINSNLQPGQTAIAVRGDDVASCAGATVPCAAVHSIDL